KFGKRRGEDEDCNQGGETEERAPWAGRGEARRRIGPARNGAAKAEMRGENHDPDERPAEERDTNHEDKCSVLKGAREKDGGDHAGARSQYGEGGHTALVQAAEGGGGVSAAGQRKEQARGEVEIAEGARKRSGENDEVHHVGGAADADGPQDIYERAFAEPNLIPRHETHNETEAADVEEHEIKKRAAESAGHGDAGIRGFARGRSHDFETQIAEDGHGDAKADARPSVGQKAAVGSVVGSAAAGEADAKQKGGAKDEEENDGHDLDHREPVLEFAEMSDADGVRVDDHGG